MSRDTGAGASGDSGFTGNSGHVLAVLAPLAAFGSYSAGPQPRLRDRLAASTSLAHALVNACVLCFTVDDKRLCSMFRKDTSSLNQLHCSTFLIRTIATAISGRAKRQLVCGNRSEDVHFKYLVMTNTSSETLVIFPQHVQHWYSAQTAGSLCLTQYHPNNFALPFRDSSLLKVTGWFRLRNSEFTSHHEYCRSPRRLLC